MDWWDSIANRKRAEAQIDQAAIQDHLSESDRVTEQYLELLKISSLLSSLNRQARVISVLLYIVVAAALVAVTLILLQR